MLGTRDRWTIDDDFEAAVHAVVRSIPAGEVMTYGEIAAEVGRPGAARAVGRIMAASDGAPARGGGWSPPTAGSCPATRPSTAGACGPRASPSGIAGSAACAGADLLSQPACPTRFSRRDRPSSCRILSPERTPWRPPGSICLQDRVILTPERAGWRGSEFVSEACRYIRRRPVRSVVGDPSHVGAFRPLSGGAPCSPRSSSNFSAASTVRSADRQMRVLVPDPRVRRSIHRHPELDRVTSRVRVHRAVTPTVSQHLVVAVLDAGPPAMIWGKPAAALWGFGRFPPLPPHVGVRTRAPAG